MTLSRNKRKIFYSKFKPPTYQTRLFHIQNADPKAPKSQLKRWALRLSSDYDWTVGLRQETHLGGINVFGLCYKGKQLSSLPENRAVSSPDHVAKLQSYEIIWHHSDSLSFFGLTGQHQRREITTIKLNPSLKNLTPFVCLEVRRLQAEVYNYQQTSYQMPQAQWPQPQWKCSCGKLNYWDDNFSQPNNPACSCGKLKDGLHITDLLCELL